MLAWKEDSERDAFVAANSTSAMSAGVRSGLPPTVGNVAITVCLVWLRLRNGSRVCAGAHVRRQHLLMASTSAHRTLGHAGAAGKAM